MKWSWAFSGPLASAALLLPILAAAESHLETAAVTGPPHAHATAHVDFRIIIPKMLALDVGTEVNGEQNAQTVAIISNNRTVTLGATVQAPNAGASATGVSGASGMDARKNVILSAAARKIIAQDAACKPGDAHPTAPAKTRVGVAVNTNRMVCTVSTP